MECRTERRSRQGEVDNSAQLQKHESELLKRLHTIVVVVVVVVAVALFGTRSLIQSKLFWLLHVFAQTKLRKTNV